MAQLSSDASVRGSFGISIAYTRERNQKMVRRSTVPQPKFTDKQGQYLAFIHLYTLVNGRPPAEADFERFFVVTPPSVHRMIVELEQRGLIRRLPRKPRSIEVALDPTELPPLLPQPIKTTVPRY